MNDIQVGNKVRLKDLNLVGVVRHVGFGHVDVAVSDDVTYTYYIENVELINEELPPLGISVNDGVGIAERLS